MSRAASPWSPTRRRSTSALAEAARPRRSSRCRSSSAPSRTTRAGAPARTTSRQRLRNRSPGQHQPTRAGGVSSGPTRSSPKAGAEAIVSVHLSSEVSGTFESARDGGPRRSTSRCTRRQPATRAWPPGSRSRRLRRRIGRRRVGREAADAARERALPRPGLFYVDTLEYLRRGGRVGAAAALVGSALAVKPLLEIEDGPIVPLEKVRTVCQGVDPARGARGRGRR